MKSSSILIAALKRFETCVLHAYQDQGGVWTIGYGHTSGVKKGDRITHYQAEMFLREDLAFFEAEAQKVKHLSTQGKFDAVVDFMFNCGIANFRKSTLRKYIESGRPVWQIQKEFCRWTYGGGEELGGLVTRRIWEANRFNE